MPRNLMVTAHLFQQTMYPLAGPYVVLEIRGLDDDHQKVGGTVLIPAEDAAQLGSVLLDMATAAGAAGGQVVSGTPQAVLRRHEEKLDIVGRGTWVPCTFAEARDVETAYGIHQGSKWWNLKYRDLYTPVVYLPSALGVPVATS